MTSATPPTIPKGKSPTGRNVAIRPRWVLALDGLDVILLGMGFTCLFFSLRAGGAPFPWLPLAVGVVVFRYLLDATFRGRVLLWLRSRWRGVEHYAAEGGTIPWLAAAVFVVVPLVVVYLANDRAMGSGDTLPVIPTAVSLLRHGDWNLDEYVAGPNKDKLPYFLVQTAGGIYSAYPAGMVPFALPVVASARLAGAHLRNPLVVERLEKATATLVAAAAMGLFFLLALRLVSAGAALGLTLVLATASTMYGTVSQGLWQHGGTIFWSLLALLMEFQERRPGGPRLVNAIEGLACGSMLACRLTAAVFLLPLGLWILLRSPRRAFAVAAWGVLAFAPWAWLYHSLYGNVLGPSVGMVTGFTSADHFVEGLAGILVSPGRGLLIYQPWVALGLAGIFIGRKAQARTDGPSGWQAFCGVVIGLHVALIAAWGMWWGGYSWGSRLLADIMPLGALLCARPIVAVWHMRRGPLLVVMLACAGFLTQLAAVHFHAEEWNAIQDIDNHPERLWSWSDPPFFHIP